MLGSLVIPMNHVTKKFVRKFLREFKNNRAHSIVTWFSFLEYYQTSTNLRCRNCKIFESSIVFLKIFSTMKWAMAWYIRFHTLKLSQVLYKFYFALTFTLRNLSRIFESSIEFLEIYFTMKWAHRVIYIYIYIEATDQKGPQPVTQFFTFSHVLYWFYFDLTFNLSSEQW